MKITKTWFKKEIEITPEELFGFFERDITMNYDRYWATIEILKFIKSFNK